MADRLVLAFDTSAAHCAAVLLSGERVLRTADEPMKRGQAERLMPLLAELLEAEGAGFGDLTAIGVGIGPGNFTGIRISVAAARGLALSLGRPAIGVSGFEAAAYGLPRPVLACLASARGEVNLQLFREARSDEPRSIATEELGALALPAGTRCSGPMAQEVAERLSLSVETSPFPQCEAIARMALARIGSPQPRPAPLYVRAADALPPRDAAPVILK